MAFGTPDYDVVQSLMNMVDMNMMSALGRSFFSTKPCVVIHTNGNPMCSDCGTFHRIQLNTGDNYWCQWVYQFAHEYCHHIINGSFSGDWTDLLWFEETLCELSSLYNLHEMIGFCKNKGLFGYSLAVEEYLNELLTKNSLDYPISADGGWYPDYLELLSKKTDASKDGYRRELYNVIAALMYPLFLENPCLWKLILHIGDIRSWNTLEALLEHLRACADNTYSDSLEKLMAMFS